MIKLYDYWRSAASFRVRIALNIKGLDYTAESIHLTRDGGAQHSDAYKAVNPQELVPSLVDGEDVLTQSMAIIEYLDEVYPTPALLPSDPAEKAKVRAMANIIAADTHPIQNLRVLQKVKAEGFDQEQTNKWAAHWIELGFQAIEKQLQARPECLYFCGDTVSIADIAIAPQIVNAKRFGADLSKTPLVVEKIERLMALPAFSDAKPENQPDAE